MSLPDTTRERLWRLIQAILNLSLFVLFGLLAISSYKQFALTGTLRSFSLLVVNTLFVSLFLARRPAKHESDSPILWVLAIAGTAVPLLLRPAASAGVPGRVGDVLQVVGLILLATSLLCLRRSFGVVAANRGIRSGGIYRFVRHPVYFSELLLLLGFVLANPNTTNVLLWICECGLQFARACTEEQLLASDPDYRSYKKSVRYRLIPGLI